MDEVGRLTRRGVRRVRADDPETGWLVRTVITAMMVWLLVNSTPAHPAVRPVLVASLASWLLFLIADARGRPVLALRALAVATLLPAGVIGLPQNASALVFLYATLLTFILMPRVPMWAIRSVSGAATALMVIGLWLTGHGPTALLAQPGLIVILLLFALHRREHRLRAEQTSRAQQAQAHAAALQERARIARELHDVLAHSLGALSVQLEVAEAQLTEKGDVAGAAERVRRARRLATDGLTEARSAVAALREDVPPLPDALDDLITAHRADHQATVSLRTAGSPKPVNPAAEVSLLRTAREALTNAARHAPGRPVTVTLDFDGPAVRLTVSNPLDGNTSEHNGGGYGLIGARERIALVGGRLEATVVDGAWRVSAEVPA